MKKEANGSVEVIIRLQPPSTQYIHLESSQTLRCMGKPYTFDSIIAHDVSQNQVFIKLGMKMIMCAKKGYNSCIFAYGQTGSGKTYTMSGTSSQDGLIQRCMKKLWGILQDLQSFQLRLSYYQIYNEQINDLLSQKKAQIKIKQSLALGFYLQNIEEVKIESEHDLLNLFQKGLKNRVTAETKMNRQSSRSHSILSLNISSKQKNNNGSSEGFTIKTSKMHFVDLAGSEKQKSTHASGERLKQASSINKSLTSLSIVIEKLSSKATHIPYRDSVLTKLLRDSLGGNSRTILIATLSSKQQAISQTISTINFAIKAKKVQLSAKINEEFDGSPAVMRKRIKQLQVQIKILKTKQNCANCDIAKQERLKLQKINEQLESQLQYCQERIRIFQMSTSTEINYYKNDSFKTQQSLSIIMQVKSSQTPCKSNYINQYSQRIRQLEQDLRSKQQQLSTLRQMKDKKYQYSKLFERFKQNFNKNKKSEWVQVIFEAQFKKINQFKKNFEKEVKKNSQIQQFYKEKIYNLQKIIEEKQNNNYYTESSPKQETAQFGFNNKIEQNKCLSNQNKFSIEMQNFEIIKLELEKQIQNKDTYINQIKTELQEKCDLFVYWQQKSEQLKQKLQQTLKEKVNIQELMNQLKKSTEHQFKKLMEENRHQKAINITQSKQKQYYEQFLQKLKKQITNKNQIIKSKDCELKDLYQQINKQEQSKQKIGFKIQENLSKKIKNTETLSKQQYERIKTKFFTELEKLNNIIASKDKQIQIITEELNNYYLQNCEMKDSYNNFKIENEQLVQKNSELFQQKQKLQKKYKSLKANFQEEQTKTVLQKQYFSQKIELLNAKRVRDKQRLNKLYSDNKIKESQLKEMKEECSRQKQRVENYKKTQMDNYRSSKSMELLKKDNQVRKRTMLQQQIQEIVNKISKIFKIQPNVSTVIDQTDSILAKLEEIQNVQRKNDLLESKCQILTRQNQRNSGLNFSVYDDEELSKSMNKF